ncbi:MAG: DUF3014 domain-containing protein [Deltaproteobacteria bacterium]|nr:DUF3014 domain-containing protein [Deltaproteobacteria bacterium]
MKIDKFAGKLKGKSIWTGVVILAILIAGGLLSLYFRSAQGPAPATVQPPVVVETTPAPPVEAAQPAGTASAEPPSGEIRLEKLPTPPVTLDQSDVWVRGRAQGLSVHPGFHDWLKIDHLIRIITVVAVNIAEGISPKPHLGFLAFEAPFLVEERASRIVLDPNSYRRYDGITAILSSVDPQTVARLFHELLPLFQEAYHNLGYPNQNVEPVFMKAIRTVLRVPLVEGEIELKPAEKGINYLFVDDRLEGLNKAQKHFIRMGPRNLLIIQDKLRQIAMALGVPKERLPKATRLLPRAGRP